LGLASGSARQSVRPRGTRQGSFDRHIDGIAGRGAIESGSDDHAAVFVDLEVRLVPIDESISYLAASLFEDHRLVDGLGITDALIAATARENGETLATGNIRHFRGIPNLSLKTFRPARS
jgi:predicted nucleic acid-binding protein